MSRASTFAAETHPKQGFASVFVTAPDGLMLHVRSYGSRLASALPVVCLPGLARTAADFHPLAAALAVRPCRAAARVGARLSRPRPIRIRSQSRQLRASRRFRRPLDEPQGLLRIKGYVGKLPVPRSFEEGAEILRRLFDAQFTMLAPQDWIALRRTSTRSCAHCKTMSWMR